MLKPKKTSKNEQKQKSVSSTQNKKRRKGRYIGCRFIHKPKKMKKIKKNEPKSEETEFEEKKVLFFLLKTMKHRI